MTSDDVRELLRRKIADAGGSQKEWADAAKVSAPYVSQFLAGRAEPGALLLQALGVERVTTYRLRAK